MLKANFIRSLSNGMIESLMEIHEREMMGEDLCGEEIKHLKGLYTRKLVDMKHITNKNGKSYMGFFVTEAGKEYLEHVGVAK